MQSNPVVYSKQAASAHYETGQIQGTKEELNQSIGKRISSDGRSKHCKSMKSAELLCLALEKELGKQVMLHVFCTAGNGKFKSRLDAKWSAEDLKRYHTSESPPFFSI